MVTKNYGTIYHIIYSFYSAFIYLVITFFSIFFCVKYFFEKISDQNSKEGEGFNFEEHYELFSLVFVVFFILLSAIWSIQIIVVVLNKRKSNQLNNQVDNGEYPSPDQNSHFNPSNSEYVENA